ALVGSIYKGKVTRVLPGMQSAFVDIGLDGDAFLYVSDVFENLEDYEPHEHHAPHAPAPAIPAGNGPTVQVLPGESLARTSERREEPRSEELHPQPSAEPDAGSSEEASALVSQEVSQAEEQPASEHLAAAGSTHADSGEERQPESNASAPQNFSPHFNPTQNYSRRSGNDRANERGNDRQGQQHYGRGGDRGRGGRWGRRGGRHHGGRQQGAPGGRNLPPSKYASPQGGEFRGYDNRDRGQQRGYDN